MVILSRIVRSQLLKKLYCYGPITWDWSGEVEQGTDVTVLYFRQYRFFFRYWNMKYTLPWLFAFQTVRVWLFSNEPDTKRLKFFYVRKRRLILPLLRLWKCKQQREHFGRIVLIAYCNLGIIIIEEALLHVRSKPPGAAVRPSRPTFNTDFIHTCLTNPQYLSTYT